MVREILKLKTDNGLGDSNPTFKDIEITEYSFKSPRMGIPTLTAVLMWPTCLDDEWTGKEYVVLRGEKYYIRQAQSSEIANNNVIKYKHSLNFESEREQLTNVYFYDVVPSWSSTDDRPNTNSTIFKCFCTIREYADRLNCAFRYAGIGDSILNTKTSLTDADTPVGDGYCVVVSDYGNGDLEQSQEISFEDQWLWDALTEGFNKFKIPFTFHSKKIIFNEYVEPISHVFKYGFDNALLSVRKNNANARIINRITFKGSGENIPYYYPNESEYGHITINIPTENIALGRNNLELVNPARLVGVAQPDEPITLMSTAKASTEIKTIQFSVNTANGYETGYVNYYQWHRIMNIATEDGDYEYDSSKVKYRVIFTCTAGQVTMGPILGRLWGIDQSRPSDDVTKADNIIDSDGFKLVRFTDEDGADMSSLARVENGKIELSRLTAGEYVLEFDMKWPSDDAYWQICAISTAAVGVPEYYWTTGDKRVKDLSSIGVEFYASPNDIDKMVGESFSWSSSPLMSFQTNLMPPKYRETSGAERFYNALNNTYEKKSGGHYTFKNPYVDGNPNEYIFTDESIKPTIEGVTNASGQLFGVIADVAYDLDDNDSIKVLSDDKDKNNAANYEHSFFYIKLNKFDGAYGFDLFKAASQADPMTIQMTSGKCNGCKFKIQVSEYTDGDVEIWKNPVQVLSPDGNIIGGSYDLKVDPDNPQDFQQDTSKNSVWVCVQKDAETFGVIMPNRSHNYMPAVNDTFNIINIDLPLGYIENAEERGMYAMLDFMENNNEEKFNFDISASRIFFAENPSLLAVLNENSRIKVEYDGKVYEQYVSEFGIDCKDNAALPDVKLTLAEKLEPSGSFVEKVAAQAADLAGGSSRGSGAASRGGLSTELADRRYIIRDRNERTKGRISSDTAFEVGDFVSGSSGGIFFVDPETGQSTLEVDNFRARMKAIFETLEIAHVRSIGGKLIITPGGSIDISFVEENEDAYRCYFKQKEDVEGAECRFIVGDDVICQSFNVSDGTHKEASNKSYWLTVTAVSNEDSYVELSKTGSEDNIGVPAVGDTICQLGSTDVSRQSAIILSTVDTYSPNITLYDGITDFTLDGKEMVDMGVDKNTHKAYFHVYGNSYIGDKYGGSYVKYDNLLKLLEIKAKISIGSTVGDDSLEDYIKKVSPPVEQEDIEDFVNNIVDPKIDGIQNQIDGVIETWFANGVPTLTNYPVSDWISNTDKDKHLGDLYFDNETGLAYRFSKNADDSYYWNDKVDSATAKALADAAKAQDTADGKRRTFIETPYPPYDKGDLWVNATYPPGTTNETRDPDNGKYYNDILRCGTQRLTGNFDIGDWGMSSNYTDDTKAEEALDKISGYEYLKKALQDVTTINGALMLSGLIRLGENNTDPNAQTVWAGHNGIYSATSQGRTIGSWWGGDMLDLFKDNDVRKTIEELGASARPAASLIRMDGSAYFANGNIGFRKDGSGWLGNDLTGIKFDKDGTMTFGSGVKIDVTGSGGIQQSLEDIVNFNIGLTALLTPCDANGAYLSWAEAVKDDGTGHYKAKSLKAQVGLWSVDFISAKGKNTSGGGSSGGGLIENVYGSDSLGSSFSDTTLTDTFNAYTINKINHDLSQRITQLESLPTLNVTTLGTGNAVTSITNNGPNITATKGTTFLTLSALTNYYTKNEVNSNFVTALGLDDNFLTWTKNGVVNKIWLPYASLSGAVSGQYTGNGGAQQPNAYGRNKVGFYMSNQTVNGNTDFKDWMLMDCYQGDDVGGAVAIGVNRQELGAYIMRSTAERTTWVESAELIGTHNYSAILGSVYQPKGSYVTTDTAQTISGAKTFTDVVTATSKWISTRVLTGQYNATTVQYAKAHSIELGYPGNDMIRFNEYSGEFYFYKTTEAYLGSGSGELMAKISPTGITTPNAIIAKSISLNGGLNSIEWDATNNAYKVNGNIYATGGVSALGFNFLSATGVSVGSLTVGNYGQIQASRYMLNISHKGSGEVMFGSTARFLSGFFLGDVGSPYYIDDVGVAVLASVKAAQVTVDNATFTQSGSEIYVTIGSTKYKLTKTIA